MHLRSIILRPTPTSEAGSWKKLTKCVYGGRLGEVLGSAVLYTAHAPILVQPEAWTVP